jgi:hypothetical protein
VRSRRSERTIAGGVIVGALVLAALAVDRFLLLPGFESGHGGISDRAKVAIWLAVNALPAFAAGLLARYAGQRGLVAAGPALAVAAMTGIGIVVALAEYISAEGGLD